MKEETDKKGETLLKQWIFNIESRLDFKKGTTYVPVSPAVPSC